MHRLTISLPEELVAAAQREARRRGVSVSAVARDAFGQHLHIVLAPDARRDVPFAAVGSSKPRDTGRRSEEALAKEWNADHDR